MEKKILFISTNEWVPFGGSEDLWAKSALYLSKEKRVELSYSIKSLSSLPASVKELYENGVKGQFRSLLHTKNPIASSLNRILPSRFQHEFELQTISYIKSFKPSLVVLILGNHKCEFAFNIANYLNKEKINYCINLQLVNPFEFFNDGDTNIGLDFYKKSLCNFFVSYQNKEILETQLSTTLINSVIVSNPFSFESNNIIPIEIPDNAFIYMANVSRIDPFQKGHDLLLEVLGQKKWKNRHLFLNLYGNSTLTVYINSLIKKLGIINVKYHGFNSNKEAIWSRNHFSINPSRMEGLSLSLLEAMSFGRAAISTNVGDASRFVLDGVNGFIAKEASVSSIDLALEKIWEVRDDLEFMGQRSRSILKQEIKEDPVIDFSNQLINLLN